MSKGEAILITGGAQRVGAYLALALAEQGYSIALHYSRSYNEATVIKEKITDMGGVCELYQADFTNMASAESLIKAVYADFPNVAALINNASIFEKKSFEKTDETFLDGQFDVNFKLPFFLTQEFIKTCCKARHVINLLDTHIEQNSISHFAYLLSKKTFAQFTQMAAIALGPSVQVNAICPGILLPSGEYGDDYIASFSQKLPLKKNGSLEDVCLSVEYLLRSQTITGQFLYIDGGEHLL